MYGYCKRVPESLKKTKTKTLKITSLSYNIYIHKQYTQFTIKSIKYYITKVI